MNTVAVPRARLHCEFERNFSMKGRRVFLLFLLLSAFATFASADGAGLDPHGIRACAGGDIGCGIDPNG
jgi:hypothetical protein